MNPWLYFWAQWELEHKVVFDGLNKLIFISPGINEVDVRADLYSAWKEWILLTADNAKWLAAFSSTGGDPLPGGQFLGRTFFLINGWRIVLDHGVDFIGNLYTEEGESPFVSLAGVEVATSKVSTLVVENTIEATVTAEDISNAVWAASLSAPVAGSVGETINNLHQASILATSLTIAGSTSSSVNTSLNKADGYYDDSFVIIADSAAGESAVRQIDKSWVTGQLDLISPLPFIPSISAAVIIISAHLVNRGRIA